MMGLGRNDGEGQEQRGLERRDAKYRQELEGYAKELEQARMGSINDRLTERIGVVDEVGRKS